MGFRNRIAAGTEDPPEPFDGPQWQYKTLNLNFQASIAFETAFNELGAQGWEFVAMASRDKVHRAIFKRRTPHDTVSSVM